jgi:hypothetical protein
MAFLRIIETLPGLIRWSLQCEHYSQNKLQMVSVVHQDIYCYKYTISTYIFWGSVLQENAI